MADSYEAEPARREEMHGPPIRQAQRRAFEELRQLDEELGIEP